jgi:class 3 adenylate cyclase
VTRVSVHIPVTRSDPPPPPKPAERRQITVLCCGLVEANELSAHLDPEDLENILAAYHVRCTDVVERLGGLVVPFSGEGILDYFGVPLAGEDDAECDVRAGLDIVSATAAVDAGPAAHRSGQDRRLELGSCASWRPRWNARNSVVGESPNLACGVRDIAEPGTVLIADSTRRLHWRPVRVSRAGTWFFPRTSTRQCEPIRSWVRGRAKAGSRHCTERSSQPSSGEERSSTCCSTAGAWRRVVRGRSSGSLASRELESLGCYRRCSGNSDPTVSIG